MGGILSNRFALHRLRVFLNALVLWITVDDEIPFFFAIFDKDSLDFLASLRTCNDFLRSNFCLGVRVDHDFW